MEDFMDTGLAYHPSTRLAEKSWHHIEEAAAAFELTACVEAPLEADAII